MMGLRWIGGASLAVVGTKRRIMGLCSVVEPLHEISDHSVACSNSSRGGGRYAEHDNY